MIKYLLIRPLGHDAHLRLVGPVESRHRSLKTAVVAQRKLNARCRKHNGPSTYLNLGIVALVGCDRRNLTESESDQIYDILIDLP